MKLRNVLGMLGLASTTLATAAQRAEAFLRAIEKWKD